MPTLKKLLDNPIPPRFFGMFVGNSSSGKTTAAASFPKPHILDFDGRIDGLRECKDFISQDLTYDQILPPNKGWHEVATYMDSLAIDLVSRNPGVPKTVIPDSITTLLRLFLYESLDLQKGQLIGDQSSKQKLLRKEGPADYGYEQSAFYQVLDFFRGLTINTIFTGHIVDVWGKPTFIGPNGEVKTEDYANSEVIGEKLSIRDKVQANLPIYFNEVYRFDKKEVKGKIIHTVTFQSSLARSALGLKGTHDITNKNFYEFWKKLVEEKWQTKLPS